MRQPCVPSGSRASDAVVSGTSKRSPRETFVSLSAVLSLHGVRDTRKRSPRSDNLRASALTPMYEGLPIVFHWAGSSGRIADTRSIRRIHCVWYVAARRRAVEASIAA